MTTRMLCGLVLLSAVVWVGCGPEQAAGPPLPPGTEVSGTVANTLTRMVVYIPAGQETGVAADVQDNGERIFYHWAVPPGEYDVYAYITGARAPVGKVTVGSEPVTLDIPENLEWKEVSDQHAGTKQELR